MRVGRSPGAGSPRLHPGKKSQRQSIGPITAMVTTTGCLRARVTPCGIGRLNKARGVTTSGLSTRKITMASSANCYATIHHNHRLHQRYYESNDAPCQDPDQRFSDCYRLAVLFRTRPVCYAASELRNSLSRHRVQRRYPVTAAVPQIPGQWDAACFFDWTKSNRQFRMPAVSSPR